MKLKKKKPMIYAQETSKVSKKWEDDFEDVGKPQFYVSGSDRGMGYDKSIDKKVDDLLREWPSYKDPISENQARILILKREKDNIRHHHLQGKGEMDMDKERKRLWQNRWNKLDQMQLDLMAMEEGRFGDVKTLKDLGLTLENVEADNPYPPDFDSYDAYEKGGMVYAQDFTQVPSETDDANSSETNQRRNPASYYNMYGVEGNESLPNIYFNIGEDELLEYNRERGSTESNKVVTKPESLFQGTQGSRLNLMSGYENYGDLNNQIYEPEEMVDSDYIKNLHQNPGELFSQSLDYGNLEAITEGDSRFEGDRTTGFKYSWDADELRVGTDLANDPKMRTLLLKSTARFDENGNLVGLLRTDGTNINLNDEQKRSIETYVKNKSLQNYVTQGKSGNDLRDYRPSSGPTPTTPTFIPTEDQTNQDISEISLKGPQINLDESDRIMSSVWDPETKTWIMPTDDKKDPVIADNESDMSDVSVKTPVITPTDEGGGDVDDGDVDGDDTIIPTDVPSQTEDGFSLGGVDYESEDAALDALRSKPQSQLSEEEYDFLYSYKPQARSGANGMRLNKYSGGGKITLKKKRK